MGGPSCPGCHCGSSSFIGCQVGTTVSAMSGRNSVCPGCQVGFFCVRDVRQKSFVSGTLGSSPLWQVGMPGRNPSCRKCQLGIHRVRELVKSPSCPRCDGSPSCPGCWWEYIVSGSPVGVLCVLNFRWEFFVSGMSGGGMLDAR
jgi:hypothetical protein